MEDVWSGDFIFLCLLLRVHDFFWYGLVVVSGVGECRPVRGSVRVCCTHVVVLQQQWLSLPVNLDFGPGQTKISWIKGLFGLLRN